MAGAEVVPPVAIERSQWDAAMRRALFIHDGEATSSRRAQRLFSASILISATRCLLTYVLLPIVSPLVGYTAGVGPAVGIPLGLVALGFDWFGIRRFFVANHPRRWPITALYLAVMGLVIALIVGNIETLAR